ncbi:MAG TPA: oligosaccharide flippase family protein [Halothiobacillus sp.]|nr:oligosaccharide flippase family protein [Halothiobacillus sp.]
MKYYVGLSILVQGYIALIGILLMPIYLHLLGAEAFGLIGLFLMAQAWVQILDMGFTPVLSRDIARMRAGGMAASDALTRLRALEWLFAVLVLGVVALVASTQHLIAQHWIHAHSMDAATIALCLTLIAIAVALRWFAGLYRGVLIGLEQQNRVNMLLAAFATLRFVGVIPLILYVSPSPVTFFVYQAFISAAELLASRLFAMPQMPAPASTRPSLSVLKAMLPMVGSMAFLNVVWIVFTQFDKLILSGILSLKDYGYFTLAALAAGGVLMLIPPLNQVVQPRLNFLVARCDEEALKTLYSLTSQLAVVGFVGVGAGLAFFAEPVLRIWTGNPEIARISAPILFWYGLGNAIVGIMLAPFMLQFARGNLRLHVFVHAALLFFLVPAMFFAAQWQGGIGTGKVFFAINLLFLLLWSPIVHKYFLPSLTWRWLLGDTLPVVALMISILWLAAANIPPMLAPIPSMLWIACAILLAMLAGAMLGIHTRSFTIQQLRAIK